MKIEACLGALLLLSIGTGTCLSATATERAAELKTWREQCNDPDYDLRLAYTEQALETGDESIKRICIRVALESDNADIRNLGLRAAIASSEKIFFDVQMPKEFTEAIKSAGNNEKAKEKILSMDISRAYQALQEGVSFIIEGASVSKGSSVWYPIAGNISQRDNGPADVVGSKVKWTGNVTFGRWYRSCDLNVQLISGGILDGNLQCDNWWPYHVTAKLY